MTTLAYGGGRGQQARAQCCWAELGTTAHFPKLSCNHITGWHCAFPAYYRAALCPQWQAGVINIDTSAQPAGMCSSNQAAWGKLGRPVIVCKQGSLTAPAGSASRAEPPQVLTSEQRLKPAKLCGLLSLLQRRNRRRLMTLSWAPLRSGRTRVSSW